jgi:hypothetical protein
MAGSTSAPNGARPNINSYNVHAREYTSLRPSIGRPRICSGLE